MGPGDVVVERFEIERLAGSGGMGSVWRAHDRLTGAPVALKVLHARGAQEVDRLGREARVLAGLSHPGIVAYVAHGRTAEGDLYLAMEWLEGEDLGERLVRAGLTPAESVALCGAVAEALAAAHAGGVVHRDLKPSNLFLVAGRLDRPKIVDFGIARAVATRAVTRTGTTLGTPGYMSPEQAQGERALDARADVFSLGCVLFECLTGRPAFAADHPLALLARILLEDPPRVRDVRPDVAAPLDELVARMLAKQPDERPADGAAVAAELARVTAALGAGERAAPAPARAAALTASEQRLVCVVLIAAAGEAAPGADGALAETVASDVAQRAGEAFVAAAARFGGRATGLADGSVVVTLLGSEAATDQAVQAARCALSLRALAGARAMVLATGRGDVSGRWPVGQVVERAAALLRAGQGSDAAAGAAGAAIRVDEVTAGLLDARFEVAGDAAGLVLQREREPLDEARRLLGRPTPFVGREAELGALEAAFAQCVAEPAARAVLVTAPAGMGKSRLRQELLARLGAHAVPASAAAAAVAPAAVAVSPVAAGVGAAAGAAAAAGAFSAAGAAPAGGVSPAAGAAAAGGVAPAAGAAPAPAVPLVLGARGDPMRAGSLFGLVAQLVRRAAGVQEGEPPPARRQKLRARLARHLRDPDALARVAEFLGEMIGVPADGEPSPPMRSARNDPRVMGDQMREAFEDWLGAECAAGPVLIVLEDLHWGDFPSVSFVDGALRRFADRPLMVLGLARPEVQTLFPDLWADRHVQEVRLGQLGRRSGERLARAVLGAAASDETVARIVERAAGNAFYLEELIRAVAAGGGEALPETVLAMVQARLAALDPAARRVLRAASVFGETFWEGGVATLLGDELATGPVRAWLDDLVERELVERRRQARFPDERELRFRHGLVREAAYETLTPDDRGVAHRVAGTWLERAGERDALVLAEHFERGGEAARALPWFQRAAALAFEGSDLEATIRLAERGVACGAAGETLGALRLLQQMAHGWRGEWAPAERCALEAFALVPRGSVGWHEAAAALVLYTEVTGNFDNFLTVLNALREERLDERAGAPLAFAVFLVSASLAMLGQRDDARAFTARLESIAPAAAAADPAAAGWIEMTRAEMAAASMDLAATLAHYAAGLEHFERARDMRGLSMAQMNLGVHLALVGDYERGEEHLRVGLARAEHFRIVLIMGYAQAFLALVQSERGARGAPRALAARAVDWFAAAGDAVGEGIARSALARILANEGDHAGAEREARAACDRVAWLPPFRTGALATLALSLLAQGRTAEAVDAAREARALSESAWVWPYEESRLWLALAEVALAAGDHDAARDALRRGRDRLHERAAALPDPVLRRSFLERAHESVRLAALARDWLPGDAPPASPPPAS